MGYITDLTDRQWELLEPIFSSNKGQHFVAHSKRDLINAVLYLVKTGCQQRLLPNDFPPHDTVWSFYRRAVKSGKCEKAMDIIEAMNTASERPGVSELLDLVRAGKINCIVIKDFSRFGRNAIETGYFLERIFPLYRTRFISMMDYYDSDNHEGGTGGIEVALKFLVHEQYSVICRKKSKRRSVNG